MKPESGGFSTSLCRRNAIRSAISWGLMFCSRPSGMSDWPVDRMLIDLGAEQGVLDALGAAELHGGRGLLGEEPEYTWPRRVAAASAHEVGLDVLVGVEDVGEELVGGAAGDAGEIGTDAVALSLALVAGLAVLAKTAWPRLGRRPA